jgi:hypothetical protein
VICFKIGNQGSRRLVLNERDQQCDCGGRAVRTIILAPGQTTQIQVPFDTQTATGLVESSISFTTSDPQQPILDFKVRAYVGTDDQKSY